MNRETAAGRATVRLLCRLFAISRQAYYAARRATVRASTATAPVVRLPTRPGVTAAAGVLAAIREIIAVEPAWGVRKVWQALRRRGLRVSRQRVWALMRPHQALDWPTPAEYRAAHLAAPAQAA